MGSRRSSPPNISFPPRPGRGGRPRPPRGPITTRDAGIPNPDVFINTPRPRPPIGPRRGGSPTRPPTGPIPGIKGDPSPFPIRNTGPKRPSGPITPRTGITSPPQIDRRSPDRRPPTPGGFFDPRGPVRPPTTPSGPVTPPTGITSPPQIDRRPPDRRPPIPTPPRGPIDRRPPTGFFGPRKREGSPTPEERRRRRMAGERPVVIERVTTEAPRRRRFREDDTNTRDFEGFRQRRPKKDVNIAQQDI